MELDEAQEVLEENGYLIQESVFDGLYSNSVFDAVFNMSDETLKEFFKLCKKINKCGKSKNKFAYGYAITHLGEEFTTLVKKNY